MKVLKVLQEMLKLSHPGHVVTLAMMIAGIVIGRNAQLSSVSAETATEARDKSTEMRLRRWVKYTGIDADVIYLTFARQILEALSHSPLVLVMDGAGLHGLDGRRVVPEASFTDRLVGLQRQARARLCGATYSST